MDCARFHKTAIRVVAENCPALAGCESPKEHNTVGYYGSLGCGGFNEECTVWRLCAVLNDLEPYSYQEIQDGVREQNTAT